MKMGLLLGVFVLTGLVFFTAVQTLPAAQAATTQAADEIVALRATLSRVEKEKLNLSARLDAMQVEAIELENNFAALKAEKAQNPQASGDASALQQSLEAVEQELTASQQASVNFREAAEAKAAEFALALAQVKMLEENIAGLEKSSEGTATRIAELEADLEASAGNSMLASKVAEERDRALAELVSLETKAVEKSKAIAELATLVASMKTRAATLEAEAAVRKNTIADLEKAVQLASISPVAACQKRTDALTSEISFGAGSTSVSANSQSLLDELAVIVAECIQEDFHLEIEGHTDNVGRVADNLVLSYWRANAVQDFLTENGIPAESMRAIGFGDSDPIADNETADGRQKNRRIVFDWERK